jgi:hypothetical protein
MTLTLPRASTEGSFLTIALRFDIRRTPRASVTVVTIGRPSGIAATARETGSKSRKERPHRLLNKERTGRKELEEGELTSDGKHLEPRSFLEDTDEDDDADDTKGDERELLCELVHRDLEGGSLLFDLERERVEEGKRVS